MPKDLLLEIGTEELPAKFINAEALSYLYAFAKHEFREIPYEDIRIYATPRRLVLLISQLTERLDDIDEEKLGPVKHIAYDKDGKPTKAAVGFAKSQGVSLEGLQLRKTEKGEYVCAVRKITGRQIKELLPSIFLRLLVKIGVEAFPKTMCWGSGNFRFARPIHWLILIFGMDRVKLNLNNIEADNYSYGHRFLSNKKIAIPSPSDYLNLLTENHVLVDQSQRHDDIVKQLNDINQHLAKTYPGVQVIKDNDLLEEVTNLVEYPQAIEGYFDEEFLQLPPEVLSTTLKHHQKCFSVKDKAGKLLPIFITISNMPDEQGFIRQGNERVIRARLADARFFFEEDRKTSLESRLKKLKGMIFQKKLGSYYDKAKRLEKLAAFIAEKLGGTNQQIEYSRQAALLSKCDLITEMVGEFPELQGIIGSHYARGENYNAIVCNAVSQQYAFDKLNLPIELPGRAVNMADKIDSIVGYIGIGILPSGSADPYAIRRQAMAIVYMLLEEKKAGFSLNNLLDKAIALYADKINRKPEEIRLDTCHLFRQRLENYFKGSRYDLVDAVLCAGFDDVPDTKQRLEALNTLSKETNFDALMIAFRRVARIIPADYKPTKVTPDLFKEEAESLLYNQFQQIKAQLAQLLGRRDYPGALAQLIKLKPHVDRFFDEVLVMADDKALQDNRLALLSEIKAPFSHIADFSKIVIK